MPSCCSGYTEDTLLILRDGQALWSSGTYRALEVRQPGFVQAGPLAVLKQKVYLLTSALGWAPEMS